MNSDDLFLLCIEESKKALLHNDVPIGAIVINNGNVIAVAHNTREKDKSIIGHAEINVILLASKKLNRWNLSDCDLYVTLEPCSMCKEVIKQSRLRNCYFLLEKLDFKHEYSKSRIENLCLNDSSIKQMYADILSSFFTNKR